MSSILLPSLVFFARAILLVRRHIRGLKALSPSRKISCSRERQRREVKPSIMTPQVSVPGLAKFKLCEGWRPRLLLDLHPLEQIPTVTGKQRDTQSIDVTA